MDEYISRESVEKYIEAGLNNPDKAKAFGHDAIEILAEVHYMPAADVAPVQKWISVKDRSPEAGGYVVCIAKRNPFSRFMPMVAKIEKNGWVNPITEQYISDVSHWMPIPEPPKEK